MGPEWDAGVADGKAGLDLRPRPEWDDDQTLLYLDGHGWGEMIAQITDPAGPWAAARPEVAR